MHNLGRFAVWLCAVLAVLGIFLTTRLLDIRHKAQSELAQRREALEKSTQQLADARREVRGLEEEHQRLTHSWGNVWTAPNSRPQPGGSGAIDLGVGTDAGLRGPEADPPLPTLYVFASPEGGQSQYLGEFVVTEAHGDRMTAAPTHIPLLREPDEWPEGTFRVRETLPANWITTTSDLYAQQAVAIDSLQGQQLELQRLSQQVQASQAALDQRLAELNGDPNPPPGAPQEVLDGLVETVRKLETARDQVLKTVNQLRRALDQQYVTLRNILASNRDQVQVLERASESAPSTPKTTQRPTSDAALTTAANP